MILSFSLSVIHPILYGSFQNRIAAGPSIIGEITFYLEYVGRVLFPVALIIVFIFFIITIQIRFKSTPLGNNDSDKLDVVMTNELASKEVI